MTSIAGDRARAVMAVDAVFEGDVNSDAAEKVWIRVLTTDTYGS